MEGQGLIPREIIEEIIYRNSIDEVISSYVTLKRAGSNFNGLCPFHSEKTPSFTVFPATKSFYCFGCGAGGDAITFIMRMENLDYPAALEFLAQRAGITIPETNDKAEIGVPRKRIFEMNLAAAKYFRQCLFDPRIGADALRYLSEERRLSGAVIKHFGLGYAPDDFGVFVEHMKRLGFTENELVTGFLCGKSQKNGRAFSMFRNRVMFPIIDVSGNIIAFGGRVMDDSKPKYLNSSDTPGFKKSRNLFALNYAKKHCEERLILCEGYMDVIALHAAGFENAVATLGTAITPDQARLISKYTKNVVISYDMDNAGRTAADKAMRLLAEVGVDVKILNMTGAKDPDEYIKKYGPDKFNLLLNKSQTGFDYKLEKTLSKYDISIGEDKIKAANEVCDIIAGVHSNVERAVYIAAAAEKLSLSVDVLTNDVNRKRNALIKQYRSKEGHDAQMSAKHIGDRINPDSAKNVPAANAEEAILGLMLLFDEHRSAVASGNVKLVADDFFTDLGKRSFNAIMKLHNSDGGYMFSLLLEEGFSPEEMGRFQSMINKRMDLSSNGADVFKANVQALLELRQKEAAKTDWMADLVRRQQALKAKKESK